MSHIKGHRPLITCIVAIVLVFNSGSGAEAGHRKSLFNGQNLDGWIVTDCEAEVRDGVLLAKSGNGLIRTDARYGDFVLELKWRALKKEKWDAGIYFRFNELPKKGPWPARYQANLLQGKEGNVNGLPTAQSSGLVKAGEWNSLELRVTGETASLKMNDQPAWKSGGLKESTGFIGLQVEVPGGGQFEFKDIYVTELGHETLFNSTDLSGWTSGGENPAGKPQSWAVEEGLLVCTGKKGTWARTTKEYGDFNLRLDYKLQAGGNSGVFLRVPADGKHRGTGGGVEVQILDDFAERYKNLKPFQYAGSVYGVAPSTARTGRPVGRWNSLEINAKGPNYRVIHNGSIIVNAEVSKFPALEQRLLKGFIGLQNHKTRVWFRDIRIGPAF